MEGDESHLGGDVFRAMSELHPVSEFDSTGGLEWLLCPVDPKTFTAAYWEKQPLIIRRGDPSYYQPLLSLADVDQILALSSIRSSDIRIVRDGQETPVSSLAVPGGNLSAGGIEALYQEYRKGATLVLLFLQERWAPLMTFSRTLAAEMSAGIQVNVYLTPPGETGFKTHYDTHDVFVLQSHGSKRWRIYRPAIQLPLLDEPYIAAYGADPGEPLNEITLNAGDLIYLPRGYLHDAAALESTSLHLTVGIKSVTWATVVMGAIRSVVDRDSRLRESLPPGFERDDKVRAQCEARLSSQVASILEQAVSAAAIDEARNQVLLAQYPSLEGHILDLDEQDLVGPGTRLRRRSNLQWALSKDGTDVCLQFHGKLIRVPGHAESELRFVANANEFTADDLPGDLDASGRLVLVRRLLREGFLTISRR